LALDTNVRLSRKADALSLLNASVLNNSAWAQRIENELINVWDHSNASDASLKESQQDFILKTDFANSFDQHIDNVLSVTEQFTARVTRNISTLSDKLDSVTADMAVSLPALFHVYEDTVCEPTGLSPVVLSTAHKCAVYAAERSARYFSYNNFTEQCYVPTNPAHKHACPGPTMTCSYTETRKLVESHKGECAAALVSCYEEESTREGCMETACDPFMQTVVVATPVYTYNLKEKLGFKLYSVDKAPMEPIVVDSCAG